MEAEFVRCDVGTDIKNDMVKSNPKRNK